MSKNSQIRKINLKANCDLSNYQMDVHDYEGFCECNSLFLNKRLQSWYTRPKGGSELPGGLRVETTSEQFRFYRNSTFVGAISRYYTKLDSWDGNVMFPSYFTNPYPQGKEKVLLRKNHNSVIQYANDQSQRIFPLSNGWYIISDSNGNVTIYNDNDLPIVTRNDMGSDTVICGYYSAENQVFRVGRSYGYATLTLYAGDILVTSGNGGYAFIYNINSRQYRYDALYIRNEEGGFSATSSDKETLCYLYKTKSVYGISALVCVLDNNVYLQLVMPWGLTGDARTYRLIGLNGEQLLSEQYSGVIYNNRLDLVKTSYDSYGGKSYRLQFICGTHTNDYEAMVSNLAFYAEFHNYSSRLGNGGFAVNFVNNVAENIAYNYHKLIYIEGTENAGALLTEIKQYTDDTVYFTKNGINQKITIAKADSWEEICTNIGNTYLIFSTITYNNALYIPSLTWFCSCDDWNNRLLWRVKDWTNFESLANSRINQNWQTKTYPVTVSAQYASDIQRVAVTGLNMAPYSSSNTWNGKDVIYDASGNPVYTGGWTTGHSLDGYYYPQSYSVNTSGMTSFWYDDVTPYTAPDGVNYDMFMADVAAGMLGSLHKKGYVNKTGFHSDPDATAFVDPAQTNYQDTPPLLGTTYLVFTGSMITIIDSVSYYLMTNSNMGQNVIIYQTADVAQLSASDKQFVINGSLYTYRAQSQRITDLNNRWVCDTKMFHYIGFSSHYAYFYCDFDKGLYAFNGDNTMTRLTTIERYNIKYTASGNASQLDTLNFPSIDLVLFNLYTAVGIIYGEQFAIIKTGNIESWSIDESRGLIAINGIYYSLILENIQAGYGGTVERLPIEIETEFYGDSQNEDNVINDTVYITVDNLNNAVSGAVEIQVLLLQNGKVLKTEPKKISLKTEDFEQNMALIKFQPEMQEAKGFRLKIKSDYEISELKIGTGQGAINQTINRI